MACIDSSSGYGFIHCSGHGCDSWPENNQKCSHLPQPKQYRDRFSHSQTISKSKYRQGGLVLVRGRSESPERDQFTPDHPNKATMMKSKSMSSFHLNRSLHYRNIGCTVLSSASENRQHGEGMKMAKAHAAECNIILDELLHNL